MRKILILAFLFFFSATLYAQKYEIGFTTGYSSFSMKELKSDLVKGAGNMPFESKVVADFPGWISFGGYALRSFGIWSLGVGYNFNSTGGRISSGDYSGKYLFDELLQCHSFGVINSFRVATLGRWRAELRLTVGYNYSTMKTEEYLQVLDTSISYSASYFSDSFYGEPVVLVSYSFPFFRIGADFGYLFDSGGSIMTESSREMPYETNWSGFRIGINIGLFPGELFRKKERTVPKNSPTEPNYPTTF